MEAPHYWPAMAGAVIAGAGVLVGLVWAVAAAWRRGRRKGLRLKP